jgi:hypothetical protein
VAQVYLKTELEIVFEKNIRKNYNPDKQASEV